MNWLPLGETCIQGDFQIEGGRRNPMSSWARPVVSAGYFRAMGIRLIRGRDFGNDDLASGVGVAVISQSVARMISPSEDVIGKRVSLQTLRLRKWLTVIGVVDDMKQHGPTQRCTRRSISPICRSSARSFSTT